MATANEFSLLKINDAEDTLVPVPPKAHSQKVPLEMEMDKENMNGRKPSGRYRYGASRGFFNGGYLTNIIEGGCKKRIFDRRSFTGYETGIKRSHAIWGSPLDDIALACGEVYNENEEYLSSDDEFDYEAEIYIVHKDKSKSFGEIPAIN